LFWRGGAFPGVFNPDQRHIRFVTSQLEHLPMGHSEAGQRGIIAHEFGHACDYAIRRVRRTAENEEEYERSANRYVAKWGFAADLRATEREHPSKFGAIGLD
jgi:hypothetical protein